MANLMKCPTCGKNTPADLGYCQHCQSRLLPIGEDQPLIPGQAPTPRSTSDLEPVLPQWLQDAREAARKTSQEGSLQPGQGSQTAPSTFSSSDLLSGLQSQSQDDDEDEIPDWLANITGQTPKPKKPQATSEVRWVEFGGSKDFTQPIPQATSEPEPTPEPEPELPSWMSTPPAEEKDELTDWLRAADTAGQPSQGFSFDAPSASSETETPDWLRSMVSDQEAVFKDDSGGAPSEEKFGSDDTPDWLRGLEAPATSSDSSSVPAFAGATDWLRKLDEDGATSQPEASDTPDWLKAMDAQSAAPHAGFQTESAETPDWLKAMDAESAVPQTSFQPETSETPDWLKAMDAKGAVPQDGFQPESTDTPDWLKTMGAQSVAAETGFQAETTDTPDWLNAMGEQGTAQGTDSDLFPKPDLSGFQAEPSATGEDSNWLKNIQTDTSDQDWMKSFPSTEEPSVEPFGVPAEETGDMPDWLKAAASQASVFSASPEPVPAPTSETPDWISSLSSNGEPVSTFDGKNVEPEPAADSESLFTELPDWLSVVDETVAPSESIPAPITNTDAIAPGELPTWVQAMRPVDAGLPQVLNSLSADKTLETRGALAGLQGVLPAAPNYAPSGKPKAHSIRLQASEEQLSHAALLEQILSAETSPVPIGSFAGVVTSRALRWTLAVILFVALTLVLGMGIMVFPLPNSTNVPLEVGGAITTVQSIPEKTPVLAIFDYEPSRAGEVEAVAVPMFDQLLMKHLRLTFISTSETGAVLAERLMTSGYLSGHENPEYVNLGYLPGAQLGIRAFADAPSVAAPYAFIQNRMFDYTPVTAWDKPALQGVTTLPQFAAIILVTDDADSARVWIEQTQSARGDPSIPLVVVSSAQSAPMLQPYFASGQINGMVSGLYGGALFEQRNNNNPGTAIAAWDAYSTGILLAIILILGGGLLNLVFGLRDHAAAREAK